MSSYRTSQSRTGRWLAVVVVIGLAALGAACGSSGPPAPASSTTGGGGAGGPTSGPATTAPSSASPSTASSSAALALALTASYQAETGALATYRNVVSALGSVGPFPNVVSAEEQHVSTITALLNRYGIAVPAAGSGQASPATLSAACNLGVSLEQQLITVYGDQIPKVSAYPDVTTAFQNLQAASRDDHLPAFRRCA